MNASVDGLRWGTIGLYAGIRHNGDQSLLGLSRRLNEMFDRKAKASQKSVHDDLRDAAGGVQKMFADVPKAVD